MIVDTALNIHQETDLPCSSAEYPVPHSITQSATFTTSPPPHPDTDPHLFTSTSITSPPSFSSFVCRTLSLLSLLSCLCLFCLVSVLSLQSLPSHVYQHLQSQPVHATADKIDFNRHRRSPVVSRSFPLYLCRFFHPPLTHRRTPSRAPVVLTLNRHFAAPNRPNPARSFAQSPWDPFPLPC